MGESKPGFGEYCYFTQYAAQNNLNIDLPAKKPAVGWFLLEIRPPGV